ncbi:hypothetical protein P9126_04740 [Bacillus glycinifermentans]|uniref:hypothetical protein n=1 Tax=Bacillus glycinifermentans TaxID=1664069 RepID=UPI002DB5C17F|nr:hypothetical protein [Bacillus glycinifermentans]MEC3606307.1 hypothetical protein [Bacillus glycinifermentans]
MLTLVHEDIYVYIDKIEEQIQSFSGTSEFVLSNIAYKSIVDQGVIEINATSGSYTSLSLSDGTETLSINQPLSAGDKVVVDLRERFYTLNGAPFLLDGFLELEDDKENTLTLSLTGAGTTEVKYKRNQVVENQMDLYFCTGIDISDNREIVKRTNVKGETKIYKTAKKEYQWSINGLWNDTEIQKFNSSSGLFRLRLVDEDGVEMEKLANCVISSFQKNSSDSGDYTYTLNGNCEKIFD